MNSPIEPRADGGSLGGGSMETLAQLAAIVECSHDAIVGQRLDGAIETWNAAAHALYGYTAAEALGKSTALLLPPGREHEDREILEKIKAGERFDHFETVRVRRDGGLVDVSLTISPIRDLAGSIVGASHAAREITQRKASEGANGQLAAIVDSSEDAIISEDLHGRIQTWNASAQRIYGYSAEEIKGKNIVILMPAGRVNEEKEVIEKIRNGGRVGHFDTVRVRKDGTVIHVSLTISPIKTRAGVVVGASHVAREIAERRRLEAANAQLAAIVESTSDAIIGEDLNGIVQTWNAGATRIYGYTAEEARNHNISILLPPNRANEEEEILSKLRRGERAEDFVTVRRRKDGQLIEVSLTISPICDSDGRVVGASHVARDITERRDFEAQLRQTQRLESLGVLAGGIAHDFNNLLTGILGNASLIAETLPQSNPMRGHLTDLILAANRAADLTTQMLAYAGKGRFIVAPVNVTQLIAEITTLVRASIPKTVNVRLDLDKSIPHVEADRNQLQQLVMNLIINGAEAMGDGRPGTIVVRTGTQELDETYIRTALPGAEVPAGEYLYIEVRDEGCGMDESTKARIFEPFFTTKFTGRGLGLAAALGIVKAHRGAIRVYSTPGEGSVFKVFFPTRPVKGRGEASQNTVTRETVLVADDEEIVRRLAKTALESHGYRVLLAANGREAIDLMREMPGAVAVAILDLTMPIVSGDEAMRELKKIQPGLPIILSSGYTEAEAMGRFETGEIAGFVKKPYTTSQLRATIRAALESAGSS